VALSFAEEDAKTAGTIKHLLLKQRPNLNISEPRTNATSRLNSLDVAQVIVIFLSPAYINSKELVEELNIALYRHRTTSHQVLYPIQVSPLPHKPTYIRLLPCDFAAMDYTWMLKALGQTSPGRIEDLAEENDISAGAANCLIEASDVIIHRLSNVDDDEDHCQVLLNNLEVQKAWEDLRENLSKEEGLVSLKRSFDAEVMEKEPSSDSGEMKKESRNEHPEENKDPGKSSDRRPADNEREDSNQNADSKKERSVSFSPHIGVSGKGSYDVTEPDTNSSKSKSCTVI
jgi:hypothetical protein